MLNFRTPYHTPYRILRLDFFEVGLHPRGTLFFHFFGDVTVRADTPGTVAVLNRDIERILDGLSADEMNDVMLILTDIKRSIKRAKCIAKRYGDN